MMSLILKQIKIEQKKRIYSAITNNPLMKLLLEAPVNEIVYLSA